MDCFLKYIFLFSFFASIGWAQNKEPESKFQKGHNLYARDQWPKALEFIKKEMGPNTPDYIAGLVLRGLIINDSISPDSGRVYQEKARELLVGSKDSLIVCKNFYGFARGYSRQREYEEAIKYYMLMDSTARKYKLLKYQCEATAYLGYSFQQLNKLHIANRYSRSALALAKQLKDTSNICRAYNALLNNYNRQADYYMENKMDTITERFGDSMLVVISEFKNYVRKTDIFQNAAFNDISAKAYLLKHQEEEAIKYALEAMKYFIKNGRKIDIKIGYVNISDIYLKMKNYNEVIRYLKKSEEVELDTKFTEDRSTDYLNYYQAYKGLGNTKLALEYLEKFNAEELKFNEDKNIDLQKLREDFETQKTNQHIEDEKEKDRIVYEQKRNFYIYISAAAFLFLTLLAFFIYFRLKTNKEREKRELQLQTQTAELSALKAQMNPHFIFNSLIAIQNYVYKHPPADVANYISNFAKLMRMILENSRKESVTIEKELTLIKYYLELQQLRFPDKFDFTINVDPEIDIESILIPPMLSQPIIENAIEHGIMNKKDGKGNIIVTFSQTNTLIKLSVKDNGVGRESAGNINVAKELKHQSLATTITEERLSLLNKKNKEKFSIEILDLKNIDGTAAGTEVILIMPEL